MASSNVIIPKIPGKDNPADALTKYLPQDELMRCVEQMCYKFEPSDVKAIKAIMGLHDAQELHQRIKYFTKHVALAESQFQALKEICNARWECGHSECGFGG